MLKSLGLEEIQQLIQTQLSTLLDQYQKEVPALLFDAMSYALLAPGKRLRPYLLYASSQMFDIPFSKMLLTALGLECVHCYSLIHDDLPCMDDADLRRSQPSVHRKFNEATALLAGNSLLTLAFQIIANDHFLDNSERCQMINMLAYASGGAGMMGGQQLDMLGETITFSLDEVQNMQFLKTGALLRFAVQAPLVIAHASEPQKEALGAYAYALGLAYQISDDLLDYDGSEEKTGKTVGLDATHHKSTFVTLMGQRGAEQELQRLITCAVHSLEIFGSKAEILQKIARNLYRRQS